MTMEVISEQLLSDAANNNVKSMDCAHVKSVLPERVEPKTPVCAGCNRHITDPYVMKVTPDLEWHSSCLRCAECHTYLDENFTCFLREGRAYCKTDYNRLFVTSCAKCGVAMTNNDLMMKADNNVYHIECFRCTACSRQLKPGDYFSHREGGLFCKEDSEVLDRNSVLESEDDRLIPNINNNHKPHHQDPTRTLHESVCNNKLKRKDGKPTRVRTVLTEKQLQTLRTCYAANPRPDALMKDHLCEMTGLSARVIRVWFQNKRCKDKKKSILMKQLQQQEKNMPGSLQGIPMVAQSPLRMDNGLKNIDPYHQQSWKQIPDYNNSHPEEMMSHGSYPSMMNSLYSNDDSAVYIQDDDYLDCLPPDSVSSQFSGASTSPQSST